MDEGSKLPFIIAVVILLLLAMYCAVCETAFSACSRSRVKNLAERGDPRAKRAMYVLDNFDKAISTILICTNIVHISTASVVTVFVTRFFGMSFVALSTVITTIVVFFAGEMLPKSAAKKDADKLALSLSGSLSTIMKVLSPLSSLLALIGETAAKLTSAEQELSVTEDEIYDIIEDMTEEGTLDEEQGELISSALQFGDVTVESIVTPRVDLVAVDVNDGLDDILALVKGTNHSRLPVYEGSIDNIIGFLQIRTFIKAYLKSGHDLEIRPIIDEALFVHSSTKIDELLEIMTARKANIAVVTDNYGGTLGVVTVEDILEELVGEIWDEDDVVEEPIVKFDENEFNVSADMHVSDVFEEIGFEDPEENGEFESTLMGEWAYVKFSAIPKVGEFFDYHGLRITVAEMEHNRILRLKVERLPEEEEGGGKQ